MSRSTSRRRVRLLPTDTDVVRALLVRAGEERARGTMDGHDLAQQLERRARELREGEEARRVRVAARRAKAARRSERRRSPDLIAARLRADDLDPARAAGRWPPAV